MYAAQLDENKVSTHVYRRNVTLAQPFENQIQKIRRDIVKVFEVCPLDRQLLNNRTPEGNKTRYDNTTKVVLCRVTYFLVGCIRFIDAMALGSLSLSSCCSEQSACEKTAQLLAKCIHDKKWKGKCKPLEFGTDFSD